VKVKFRTEPFRVQYAEVFVPKEYTDDDGKKTKKYEVTALFPKAGKNKVDLKNMRAVAKKVIEAAGLDPEECRNPFGDGDKGKAKKWPGFPGHYFVRMSSQYEPDICDLSGTDIVDPEKFYNGCWAIATTETWAYDTKGNEGMGFGLRNLLFIRDDEPLKGGPSAAEDFDDLIEEDDGSGFDDDGDDANLM
jgi:hypothetical protein